MSARCGRGDPWLMKLALSLTFLGVLLVGGTALSTEAPQLASIEVTPFRATLDPGVEQIECRGEQVSFEPVCQYA